jgi:hypothetical protein
MICSKCKSNYSEDQFIWNNIHHKTCKRCKKNQDQKNISQDINQEVDVDIERVEIDCLDVGDFIESEIKELEVSDTDIVNTIYQANLLVNLDITPDITAKDAAALVIAEIECGDNYSWK